MFLAVLCTALGLPLRAATPPEPTFADLSPVMQALLNVDSGYTLDSSKIHISADPGWNENNPSSSYDGMFTKTNADQFKLVQWGTPMNPDDFPQWLWGNSASSPSGQFNFTRKSFDNTRLPEPPMSYSASYPKDWIVNGVVVGARGLWPVLMYDITGGIGSSQTAPHPTAGGLETQASWPGGTAAFNGFKIQPGITWNGLTLVGYLDQIIESQTNRVIFIAWQNQTSQPIDFSYFNLNLNLKTTPASIGVTPNYGLDAGTIGPGQCVGEYIQLGSYAFGNYDNFYVWGLNVTSAASPAPATQTVRINSDHSSQTPHGPNIAISLPTVSVGDTVTFTASAVDQTGNVISGDNGGYVWSGSITGTGIKQAAKFDSPGTYAITVSSPGNATYAASNPAKATITVTAPPENTVRLRVQAVPAPGYEAWFIPSEPEEIEIHVKP